MKRSILFLLLPALLLFACAKSPETRRARHLEAAKKLLAAHDPNRAILEFKNALAIRANDPDTQYQTGLAYLSTGDWARAAEHLRKATDLNPSHSSAQLRFAEILATTDNPALIQEARRRLKDVFTTLPGDTETLTALAVTEWKMGEPDAAEKHLREALDKAPHQLGPAFALAKIKLSARQIDEAEAVLRKAANDNPTSAQAATILGEFFLTRQRTPDAQASFEQALRLDPNYPQSLQKLADLYFQNGRKDDAAALCRRLAALPDKSFKSAYAAFLFRTGDKEHAIAELRRLLAQNPSDLSLRDQLVAALVASERLAEADTLLTAELKKSSGDYNALIARAALYLTLQRYEDAEKDLTRVLSLRRQSAEGHYLFSKLHEVRGQDLSERQSLNDALTANPAFLPARLELSRFLIRKNDTRQALSLMDATPAEQRPLVAVVLQRNWALLAAGDTAAVERSLASELKGIPVPEITVLEAVVRLNQRKPADARTLARQVLAQDPEDLRALEILSRSYAAENNMEAAVRELASYAAARPNAANVQHFFATILLSYGRRTEARAALNAALAARPGHPDVERILVELDAAEGRYPEARQLLDRMVAEKGNHVFARLWLGNVAFLSGDAPTAIDNYKQALAYDPNQLTALNNLASLLAEKGQPDLALGYAQRAAELAPENAAILNTLGWVLYQKGLYSMAVRQLESAASKDANALHNYQLALAYLKTGDSARGQRLLASVIRQFPDTPQAREARKLAIVRQ